MCGAKTGSTRASGRTTKCTELVRPNGQMDESMRANILTIKNTESAHFTGKMEESTMELGKMEDSMEGVSTI